MGEGPHKLEFISLPNSDARGVSRTFLMGFRVALAYSQESQDHNWLDLSNSIPSITPSDTNRLTASSEICPILRCNSSIVTTLAAIPAISPPVSIEWSTRYSPFLHGTSPITFFLSSNILQRKAKCEWKLASASLEIETRVRPISGQYRMSVSNIELVVLPFGILIRKFPLPVA